MEIEKNYYKYLNNWKWN